MEKGDIFYIKVLGETFAYQVDQILTVLPENTKELTIVPGKDYVTLVTCTPYAVNTHRLLVRGYRIPYEEAVEKVPDVKNRNRITVPDESFIYRTFHFVSYFVLLRCCCVCEKEKEKERKNTEGRSCFK